MQIPTPNPTSLWVPISGITGIICALFAVLAWAGIKPESLLRWKLKPTSRRPVPAWTGWLIVLSIALGGSSLFMAAAPTHPKLAWVLVGALVILAVVVWVVLKNSQREIFDAEIYRVVISSKGAFATETQQLFEGLSKREFAIDVDVLVELYVVNVSDRTHYLRDIQASVEIDGMRHPMFRQSNFDAFDVNGTNYEYCIDPAPTDNRLLASGRAVGMDAIAPSLPVALESRKPLDGWVHFVVKDVNPKKMEKNQTLQFFILDSMGKRHPVSRPAGKPRASDVVVRPKREVGV